MQHTPVLLSEILHLFENRSLRRFVDATLGAGGHSLALLNAHPELEFHVGMDRDESALELTKKSLPKVHRTHAPFAEIEGENYDGILADLGVSSMQLDQKERGFSFMQDAPLDMRMDRHQGYTAQDILAEYSENDLATLFKEFGEEPRAKVAARAIVSARIKTPIKTTHDLTRILGPVCAQKKSHHSATRCFQALRIAVNDEIGQLKAFLKKAPHMLAPKGILAIITFHSIEDRLVKHAFLALKQAKSHIVLTKKPLKATREESLLNRRARGAKLRAIERC